MRIRQANAADVPALMNLERETAFAAHWPQQQYEHLFQTADGRLSERYVWLVEKGQSTQAREIFEAQHRVLGFLIARRMNEEWELENIVVSSAVRRQGLGKLLVTELIARARQTSASHICLEVRESNQNARGLYEKLGFETAGLRKNYYSSPQENAVLYRLDLC